MYKNRDEVKKAVCKKPLAVAFDFGQLKFDHGLTGMKDYAGGLC